MKIRIILQRGFQPYQSVLYKIYLRIRCDWIHTHLTKHCCWKLHSLGSCKDILQKLVGDFANFVAFSEYMNVNYKIYLRIWCDWIHTVVENCTLQGVVRISDRIDICHFHLFFFFTRQLVKKLGIEPFVHNKMIGFLYTRSP